MSATTTAATWNKPLESLLERVFRLVPEVRPVEDLSDLAYPLLLVYYLGEARLLGRDPQAPLTLDEVRRALRIMEDPDALPLEDESLRPRIREEHAACRALGLLPVESARELLQAFEGGRPFPEDLTLDRAYADLARRLEAWCEEVEPGQEGEE